MSTSPELQSNFVNRPPQGEIETEFNTSEIELRGLADKALLLDVLEEAAYQHIELGGDIAELVPEDLEAEVQELRSKLMVEPDEPVTLTDETAEYIYGVFQAVADTEEIKRDVRNEARYMLGKPLIPTPEPKVELTASQEAERLARVKREIDYEMKKIIDPKGKTTSSEVAAQPQRYDENNEELPEGSYLSLRNETEIHGLNRALTAIAPENGNTPSNALLDKIHAHFETQVGSSEDIDEGYVEAPLELDAREAKVAQAAMKFMATGLVKNEVHPGSEALIEHDRENARYILKAWRGEAYEPNDPEETNVHILAEARAAKAALKHTVEDVPATKKYEVAA